MNIKGFPIDIAHCNSCNIDFLYVLGKINSVMNRDSDVFGCPRCPSCGRFTTTRNIGKLRILQYRIEDER